jgi:hypothetical protein
MSANKVRIGFFSFTEITPTGDHRAYNEWHQLDHMPEQFPIPGVAHGQRWVCAPRCAAARVAAAGALARTHYLTLYLMTEPVAETLTEYFALADHLHAVGRFYQHRRSHLSGPLEVVAADAAPRVQISAEAVPYRPNRGIYALVEEDPEGEVSDLVVAPADLVALDGVAGVWVFATTPDIPAGRWTAGRRRLTVCYLDGEPVDVGEAIREALPRGFAEAASYAGPLLTITPWHWDWFD